jgi:uncharacterized protein GlcG (DUF336 family)
MSLWNFFQLHGPRKKRTGPVQRQLFKRSLQVEQLEERMLLNSDQNALFVTKAYQDLLHRAPDPIGQTAFTSGLNRALIDRFDAAVIFTSSQEYRDDLVQDLYMHYLRRSADPTGLNADLALLMSGGTIEQVVAALVGSQEYLRNQGGGSNDGFLAALYQDVLGRAIDPVGQAVFRQELASGTSRTQVASQILSSAEYQQLLVSGYYQDFLHRVPDPGGLAAFAALLQQGTRDENIVARLLSSEEYAAGASDFFLAREEVTQLLDRAAAASASNDAIIAVVDRGGRVLGVRLESGVSPAIQGNSTTLTFAVDGALALARTAAFFANDQAPLTSRTVQFISQSTITQREVESNPSVTDPNSPLRGPGFVAPVGLGGHFPPNIPNTPPVDLFGIEHTNRDTMWNPGPDGIIGTADDVPLPTRFNADLAPGVSLTPPISYGTVIDPTNRSVGRGISTLPGGIPLFKFNALDGKGELVGGIGVFFPGSTGYATAENSRLSATFNPALPDRSFEAEYTAFAAAGGSSGAGASIGTIAGISPLPGFDLPSGRIDLAGITLDIFGPGGLQGPSTLIQFGSSLGTGNPFNGLNLPVQPGVPCPASDPTCMNTRDGVQVPEGWLVVPHGSADGRITAADVVQIVTQGIAEANLTRAQIRLPLEQRTKMVFAVTDSGGNVLGLYRMHDATVFSIDVAVAKARNVAYYDDPAQLLSIDQVPGIPSGVAFTARTFRFLAQPRFPEGIDGTPPAPFSILNDPGIDRGTGLDSGVPLPASVYQSVYGFDSFHPGTNFRQPPSAANQNGRNQNGVIFFPGSSVLYKVINGVSVPVGGLGVSGDGVDQDDFITAASANGFQPAAALRADQFFLAGVRLPYQRFPRNPLA